MSKKKSPTVILDEEAGIWALNRKAKKTFKAKKYKHTVVPMIPLSRLELEDGSIGYLMNGDAFVIPYSPRRSLIKPKRY